MWSRRSQRSRSASRSRSPKGSFVYDAWGIPDQREGDEDERRSSLSALFGYLGERQDPSSGLVFLRARWYAPELGRFLSRDAFPGSSADPRTQHLYAYAQDNPTSKVDRTGFSAASLFDAIDGYAYDGAAFYDAFPAPASFRLPANAPAPARPADRGLLGGIGDFAGGFVGGAVNTVKGVAEVGAGVYRSTVACQFGFVAPLQQLCADQWQANRALAGYIAEDPGRFARQPWDAATENCANLLASASSAGGCAFDVASIVLGAKGIDKIAKLSKVSRAPAATDRLIVIGETSPRVRAIAEALNAGYYKPIPLPRWVPRAAKIRLNERWLAGEVRAGATVLDIGPDFRATRRARCERLLRGGASFARTTWCRSPGDPLRASCRPAPQVRVSA